MRTEMVLAALRAALPYVAEAALPQICYGSFHGGDPRLFTPDKDGGTPAELARWQADCAAAEKSGAVQPSAHQWQLGADCTDDVVALVKGVQAARGEEPTGPSPEGAVHITRAMYGLGTYELRDEEAEQARSLVVEAIKAAESEASG